MESQLANTSDALDAIKVLYDTGKYADMKIRCEDKVFDVHRAIVCIRSPVIAAAMDDDRWVCNIPDQDHVHFLTKL